MCVISKMGLDSYLVVVEDEDTLVAKFRLRKACHLHGWVYREFNNDPDVEFGKECLLSHEQIRRLVDDCSDALRLPDDALTYMPIAPWFMPHDDHGYAPVGHQLDMIRYAFEVTSEIKTMLDQNDRYVVKYSASM